MRYFLARSTALSRPDLCNPAPLPLLLLDLFPLNRRPRQALYTLDSQPAIVGQSTRPDATRLSHGALAGCRT